MCVHCIVFYSSATEALINNNNNNNHYATETPPIPDALLVLVAPKHIHRNVTTTLHSRFTPTPTPQATHSSFIILFYLIIIIIIIF